MKKTFVAIGLASLLSLGAVEFGIDMAHSQVAFKAKHLLITNINGNFKEFSGVIDYDKESKKFVQFEGKILINSINTENAKRDNHLRSADFFDASKFPEGYFKMEKQEGNKLYGVLTLRGVSQRVVFDIEVSPVITHPKSKKEVMAVALSGKINRKQFKIGDSTLDAVVGDEIKINADFELIKK